MIMHMMTNTKLNYWKTYCCEPLELVENYAAAKADNFASWCMHHRLEIQPDGTRMSVQELIDQNLYYRRPANELVFMRREEHSFLHSTGNTNTKGRTLSAEHRKKIAEALSGENHPFFGKHHSKKTRLKMSESRKGKHWWNDGVSCKLARECPGEGWTRGRLSAKFKYFM